MNNSTQKLNILDEQIKALSARTGFENAQKVINAVVGLFDLENAEWKLFNDSQKKIRSNATWFKEAQGFSDRRATYKIADSNSKNIDFKAFWTKNASKSIISWLVALTPNFEDEDFDLGDKVGIDFIIPENADKVIVALSNRYIVRTLLRQYLSEDIKIFDEKHAAYFTNRLIGRIVFCWFLDKKGIINPKMNYFEVLENTATDYYRQKLEILFFKVLNTPIDERGDGIEKTTPFLNGGLFEVKNNDKFGEAELKFPADYFDRFFKFLRHYNFTTDESTSTFQQVAIDPEMLGRIFENLLAEQTEETGQQARKAKGAFYTPREIVDYMCRESLREYLKTKTEATDELGQKIDQLLDSKPHEWRDQQKNYRDKLKADKYNILQALDEIKVLDPACGSGAFPMGMLHLLLQTYERIDSTFDSYKKKLNIIKNSLFGVDIEPMAVEISRLRAWLSIIVDEESDSKKIEPLPNLDFKFICANSLIPLDGSGIKKLDGDIFGLEERVQEIRDKYFNARLHHRKEDHRKTFEKIFIEANKDSLFGRSQRHVQLSSYHPFDSENVAKFFDSMFMFGEKGFDVVIGNPPYVTLSLGKKQSFFTSEYLKLLEALFLDIKEYKNNTFSYFIKRAYDFSNNGIVSYIVPNVFLYNKSFSKIRKFMLDNSNISYILDIKNKVFENAEIGGNCVFVANKKEQGKLSKVMTIQNVKDLIVPNYEIIKKEHYYLPPDYKFYIDITAFKIFQKIDEKGKRLSEICNFYNGIKTGNNKEYLKENKEDNLDEIVIRGRDVQKYYIDKLTVYVHFDRNEKKFLIKKKYDSNNSQASHARVFVRAKAKTSAADF